MRRQQGCESFENSSRSRLPKVGFPLIQPSHLIGDSSGLPADVVLRASETLEDLTAMRRSKLALPAGSSVIVTTPRDGRLLTATEFSRLSVAPPEIEWFTNIDNENKRRAYRNDLYQFMMFTGIQKPTELREIPRAHVLLFHVSVVILVIGA